MGAASPGIQQEDEAALFKLYWAPRTGAFAPEATLLEIGAAFEAIRVDTGKGEQQGEAYRRLNPVGQIPALELPDGSVMTESLALCLWLADAYPDAGLIPPAGEAARARLLRWLIFGLCNIYESDLRYSYASRYTSDPDGVESVRTAAARRMDDSFAMLDAALGEGPYLLGERYSVADPYILMLTCWQPDTAALLHRLPNVARLCAATMKRPAIADALRRYDMSRDLTSLA